MRRKLLACLAAFMLLAGICVLLYPVASNLINRQHGSYAIQELGKQLENMDAEQMRQMLEEAKAYNRELLSASKQDSEQLEEKYREILDFGNGMMGYIQIPAIDVKLPIYHGVDAQVLEKGVGHMPESAFPVGGEGNHAVLTGHTGLPSARLFTDLVELKEGDLFQVTIGNKEAAYRVDQIKVVLPNETEDLQSIPGEDYCTLVTCTPYGVNSHRLLVRGSKVDRVETPTLGIEMLDPEKHAEKNWWLLLLILPMPTAALWVFRRKRRK